MKEREDIEITIYWLQAVIYQGDRLIKSYKAKGHILHTTSIMEEQFFINAIYKARRWASKLKKLNVVATEMDVFVNSDIFENPIEFNFLRNKREHDEEYFGLESINEPLVDVSGPTGPTFKVSQSVTVFQNGQILLGGTLDVHKAISASDAALSPLIELQHEYWKKLRAQHFQAPRTLIDE